MKHGLVVTSNASYLENTTVGLLKPFFRLKGLQMTRDHTGRPSSPGHSHPRDEEGGLGPLLTIPLHTRAPRRHLAPASSGGVCT